MTLTATRWMKKLKLMLRKPIECSLNLPVELNCLCSQWSCRLFCGSAMQSRMGQNLAAPVNAIIYITCCQLPGTFHSLLTPVSSSLPLYKLIGTDWYIRVMIHLRFGFVVFSHNYNTQTITKDWYKVLTCFVTTKDSFHKPEPLHSP